MESRHLVLLEQRLSQARLGKYRSECGNDLRRALDLYAWNAQVVGAFWDVLAFVEVVLRNAIDTQLVRFARQFGTNSWYLQLSGTLSERHNDDIAAARQRAMASGRAETHDSVVAELTFGFWRLLMSGRYETTLWRPSIRLAFPNFHGRRKEVFDALGRLNSLRNRLAHHKPIYGHDLNALYEEALVVVGWICPVSAAWIDGHNQVRELVRRRPAAA